MAIRRWIFCAALGFAGFGAMPAGQAQEHATRSRTFRPTTPQVAMPSGRGQVRDLTINRSPLNQVPEFGSDGDIFLDGAVRYNSIRTFDPAPYADSGRQYPFGLDGIGGYGSDLGFSAGHDSAVYDRGP